MAKKQVPSGRTENQNNSKAQSKSKSKNKNSTAVNTKNRNRNKISKTANGDASREEIELLSVPSSSTESHNHKGDVVQSSGEDEVEERSSTDEREENHKPEIVKKKSKKVGVTVRSKGKKRIKEEEENEEEAEEKSGNALYKFPMNRISRIIKSDIPDSRVSQEAVFLINRASEKFLQLFSREAYACAFIDEKNYTAYCHLSSAISKRRRFSFLSDIVPEKVRAEEALVHMSTSEKNDAD